MTIDLELSQRSIERAIKQVNDYQQKVHTCMNVMVSKLWDVGYKTAMGNRGKWGNYIQFEPINLIEVGGGKLARGQVSADNYSVEAVLYAEAADVPITWYTHKTKEGLSGEKSYNVKPLLLAEFGSGWLANVLDNVEGVGQGTMPGQVHAFDPDGWYWYDEDGTKHHSMGEAPTYPMHSALVAMLQEIDSIARSAFSGI